ncbi:uncharacterized protein [Spinacia oleracea]|uniref:F-box associated beta-propeller type 1 domain-containing protein n=1 Tax=Spinacia oleracea TaxID=3562 RepID=A0A9R0JZW3_SPIOL|nr:uncharacterized protein LOC110792785 [Spinacia oleracea]
MYPLQLRGLICLYVRKWKKGEKIIIFNPTTRELVDVPLVGSHNVKHYQEMRYCVVCGFGFDSTRNDYKIILITTNTIVNWTWLDVDVYSVRDGQWHSLNDLGPLQSLDKLACYKRIVAISNAKGRILNFKAILCIKGKKEECLLSFDMVDEVFRVIPMPPPQQQRRRQQQQQQQQDYDLLESNSSKWEACLYNHVNENNGLEYVDIWVLNEISNYNEVTWSKRACIKIPNKYYLDCIVGVWMNDNELLLNLREKVGKDLMKTEMFVYDVSDQRLIRAGRKDVRWWFQVYGESLVSIKGNIGCYNQDVEQNDQLTFFVREILGRSHVLWSCSFKFDEYSSTSSVS